MAGWFRCVENRGFSDTTGVPFFFCYILIFLSNLSTAIAFNAILWSEVMLIIAPRC